MNKTKRKTQANFVPISINALIGIVLWLITAGIMSWLISSDRLKEPSAIIIAPLVQGVIAYVITTLTYFGVREGEVIVPLLTPCIYLVGQIIVALLFWRANLTGVIRGGVAIACGVILAFITYKLNGGRGRRKKAFIRRSR